MIRKELSLKRTLAPTICCPARQFPACVFSDLPGLGILETEQFIRENVFESNWLRTRRLTNE